MERRWLKSYPEKISPSIIIPDTSILDFFNKAVRERPEQVALVFNGEKLTYSEVNKKIRKLAAQLQKKNIKKGTRIALMMNNCPELVYSYFAVLYCGGIVVQNNPMYKERELEYQIKDSGAEYLIIEEALLNQFSDLKVKFGLKDILVSRIKGLKGFESVEDLNGADNAEFQPVDLSPKEDIAVLQYTGGTTGVSKGVMLSHYNLAANVIQTSEFMGVYCEEGKEKILNVLPLFHVYGMTVSMNLSIYLQSSLYLEERFNADRVLSIIENEKITMFPGTPTIYVAVNNHKDITNYNLSSIHTCVSGSSPLPVDVKNQFESLTGAKIVDAYGLSEASPVTHSNPVNGIRKPGSIGLPIPNTECRIVDISDGESELPINTPGELIIKGPQIMLGYWKRKEETANALREGWLYTGDIASMDEDGYCHIVSRKKDVIIVNGYNVYPREIEEIIFEHPAVQEVVVAGIPDSYHGEIVKAFIVLNQAGADATEQEILEFCQGRIAKYKLPAKVKFMKELPKTAVGKILRRKLIETELNTVK